MNEQEKLDKIAEMTDSELVMRRKLLNFAIKTCQLEGDPYNKIPYHKAGLKRITAEIRKRKQAKWRKDGGKPESVTIKAKLGKMGARQVK